MIILLIQFFEVNLIQFFFDTFNTFETKGNKQEKNI